jgi:signal transduction histidine kinase
LSAPLEQIPSLASQAIGPAELEVLRPIVLRVTRVAAALFDAGFADAVLFDGDMLWRASGRVGESFDKAPASSLTRTTGSVVWIPDVLIDDRVSSHPGFRDSTARAYIGAPILLKTGARVGALSVLTLEVTPFDEERAAQLQDLADLVGQACDGVIAMAEREAVISKLARSEQRLKIAVESADLYIYEMDYRARELIKFGNELSFYAEPQTYEYCLQEDGYSVIHPDDRPAAKAAWARHVAEGTPNTSEWRVNRDDKVVWVHGNSEVITDDQGRPICMIGSFQNITERKKAELAMAEAKATAETANAAKSTFLATMSHEIRTPLNGVLGMAQAMAADDLSSVQRDRLDVIRQSGESLLAILNDMLDLSKIEAGKLELEEIEFDLGEIARGAHATFTALANKQQLSFGLDIDGARGVYRGDPTRLRQIIYNMISNGLKFTEAGEIRVAAVYDDRELIITVADTGIGMSPATLENLFSKFTQADTSTTRRFGGTGLGLAICKQLAELMGGSIAAVSREGEGSTFTLRLPLIRVGDARDSYSVAAHDAEDAQALDLRVLVAEDNSVNQLVVRTLLHQIGVEPTIVDNGQLAVEAWETGDWDAILMDVQMPVMDGLAATRAIRAREAETSRAATPIIALTANAMGHQLAEYQACGMNGHVTKPIDAARLFETLQAVLNDRAAAASRAA